MRLSRDEVITRLCQLCAQVMRERFDCEHAADCFCGSGTPLSTYIGSDYRFDTEIIEFVEHAVQEALSDGD